MKKTIAIVIAASFALAACGSKNKSTTTTPKNDAGSMGGATYAKPGAPMTPAPPTPTTTATPNPCGAGM